jgi:K+-transporting ATPase KdpF subunit
MNAELIIVGLVTLGLFIYLVYTLLYAEKL